jgi:hypothetical protein
MKAPARKSQLDQLTNKLRDALRRETTNVIEIGDLLLESRKLLAHGKWQDWLDEHFDLSYRTALNYRDAAEYVARKSKSETVAHFASLSPFVLYTLATGRYDAKEEEAILAATHEGRVDGKRAHAICQTLKTQAADVADASHDDDDAEDAESMATLDGPPPDVPPPAPIAPPPDFALHAFDQAVSELKQLLTKPATKFADTVHTANDLEEVLAFLQAVLERTKYEPP